MEWSKSEAKILQVAAILLWNLWSERNYKVFQDRTSPSKVILARMTRQVMEQKYLHQASLQGERPSTTAKYQLVEITTFGCGEAQCRCIPSCGRMGWYGHHSKGKETYSLRLREFGSGGIL